MGLTHPSFGWQIGWQRLAKQSIFSNSDQMEQITVWKIIHDILRIIYDDFLGSVPLLATTNLGSIGYNIILQYII